MKEKTVINGPVYDARTLGKPRMMVLGLQHMFAMFGATVLVPMLTGLDIATTLLFAGLGTLLFHLLTKGEVPAFLGSSFAFIGGYNAIRTIGTDAAGNAIYNNDLLVYACFGVACAGLMYVILSALFKAFGVRKVMRFFPPIVTGPIIISIGLILSSSAITNCSANWLIAIAAIVIVICFNIWGKGDQDNPHTPRRHRILRSRSNLRPCIPRTCGRKSFRCKVDRPPHSVGKQRFPPVQYGS